MIKSVIKYAIVAPLLFSSVPVFADINLGVFPRRPPAMTHKLFKPLVQELESKLGEKVNLIVEKDFKTFWKGVKSKKYDVVHYNQYHYVQSHKELGYNVIVANKEQGSNKLAGMLSVRKDSGIKSIADLKGKNILFGGGKKAMVSYIAPTAILKKAGLVEGRDYKVSFARNPPSTLIAVYNKAADAAASGDIVLRIKAVTSKIDTAQILVLAKSQPIAHLPWAVKDSMSKAKAKKIQNIMVSLKNTKAGKKVLKAAKINEFEKIKDADYNTARDTIKYVTGKKF